MVAILSRGGVRVVGKVNGVYISHMNPMKCRLKIQLNWFLRPNAFNLSGLWNICFKTKQIGAVQISTRAQQSLSYCDNILHSSIISEWLRRCQGPEKLASDLNAHVYIFLRISCLWLKNDMRRNLPHVFEFVMCFPELTAAKMRIALSIVLMWLCFLWFVNNIHKTKHTYQKTKYCRNFPETSVINSCGYFSSWAYNKRTMSVLFYVASLDWLVPS